MRTRKTIEADIKAAEKTASGASSALEKMADTLSTLKSKVGLGGADTDLQAAMSKQMAEQFKRDAANETLEALQAELKELEVHDERQKRLEGYACLLYTSPSPRDQRGSRMPSSA